MYRVAAIPADLRHEESIIKAAQSLDCLQKTINSIFEHINARIERNNNKVRELSDRIECAHRKIQSLVGTKRAIKIVAPARFPAAHILNDIPVTFAELELPNDMEPKIDIKSKFAEPTAEAVEEKLLYFHVRNVQSNDSMLALERKESIREFGLGGVPNKIKSVTALLRSNTDEFAYDCLTRDNTKREPNTWKRTKQQQRIHRQERIKFMETEHQRQLQPAPHSLAHRNFKADTLAGNLRYTPLALEAPAIDVPMNLPDLLGVANDIHYVPVEQSSIAPSHLAEDSGELPTLIKETNLKIAKVATANSVIVESSSMNAEGTVSINTQLRIPSPTPPTSVLTTPTTTITPPPLPPTPTSSVLTAPTLPLPSSVIPPPPPPPPPIKETAMKAQKLISTSPPTSPTTEKTLLLKEVTDKHSELMAAIRSAGGTRGGHLRATRGTTSMNTPDEADHQQQYKSTDAQLRSKVVTTGDLMADLHNKLLMRRKGISGAQNNKLNNKSGNPVLVRLSAIIPPPVKPRNSKSTDDEHTDDNDNTDDWED